MADRANPNDERDITETPSPQHIHEHRLVRTLGLVDVVMIGIAGMIGGAIFVLVGPAIGLAGSAVIIAFIINATITLFTAMGYAELGSALPEAGGGYMWVREGLPRPNAFISGWMAWFAHIVAGSLYAVGYGSFQVSLLQMVGLIGDEPLFGFIPLDKLIAVLSIALFIYINVRGASETGKVGIIVTVIQLGTILTLVFFGILSMHSNPNWYSGIVDNYAPLGIAGIVAAMGLTFIAFEGYEIIVQTGEEVKNPKKNIPRAIFISLTLVVVLYCLVAFVSIGAFAPFTPTGEPAWRYIGSQGDLGIMKAAETFLPFGPLIILSGGIVSSLAALNATTYSSSRVAFAMGRYYNLPHQLSQIHPKFKTPFIATITSGVIMAVMAYALPLTDIAIAAGVIFLLLFTQVNIAVITIRRIYGDKLNYGFKTPFFPVIPIIGIFLKIGLAVYLLITHPLSWVISLLWIAIGFAIYRLYTFRKEIGHYAPIVTSEGDITRKDFRILLPYIPENPDRLTKYAIRIAKDNDGEINILRIITVPTQTPLSAGSAFTQSAARAFEPLEQAIEKEGILNHYLVRISHDATEALVSTIEEQHIDLFITEFDTFRTNRALQALVTCNILAVLAGGTSDEEIVFEDSVRNNEVNPPRQKTLVVVYDGGDHADFVLKTASWLEHSGKFNVIVLSISRKHDTLPESKPRQEQNIKYLEQIGVEFTEVNLSEDIEKNPEKCVRLISSSINACEPDLVVTGLTIGNFNVLDNDLFASMLDRLSCPAIVARAFVIPGVSRVRGFVVYLLNKLIYKIKKK
ncbi:MAG: amino acid permease [Nitrososphaeraceae archaeon]